ncbi:MAG: diphosphomevalonate decarboxylase [Flavobacteriales bacterium]|nr:diphosphomevalonate decarboxylase [Flavobacteriales bacterium]
MKPITISQGHTYSTTWSSPSNIALVKYWGKKGEQIPANPSFSFTLDKCKTTTTLDISPMDTCEEEYSVKVYLNDTCEPSFVPKIKEFFARIKQYAPYLSDYSFTLHTANTFPHSSGIASSASGMSALALCLVDFENAFSAVKMSESQMKHRASFYARLGSGSASRSIYPVGAVWGEHPSYQNSSDLYAVEVEGIHKVFTTFLDTVLLVEKGKKSVSSTIGHALMKGHPYAEKRFLQANENMNILHTILQNGDVNALGTLTESEALTLHAMMMTASPYYILFAPATIAAINEIWAERKNNGTQVYFTLDAGANVHVLYPESAKDTVRTFIDEKLKPLCAGGAYIHDNVGGGAEKIS